MDWKKICCAVDFSDTSFQAMLVALDLAEKLSAVLTLHHVHAPPPSYAPADKKRVDAEASVAEYVEQVRHDLDELKREAQAERPSVTLATELSIGEPVEEIVKVAQREKFDLLVLGTLGRTGLAHVLAGSVAERVVRRAPCPVLTIRRGQAKLESAS